MGYRRGTEVPQYRRHSGRSGGVVGSRGHPDRYRTRLPRALAAHCSGGECRSAWEGCRRPRSGAVTRSTSRCGSPDAAGSGGRARRRRRSRSAPRRAGDWRLWAVTSQVRGRRRNLTRASLVVSHWQGDPTRGCAGTHRTSLTGIARSANASSSPGLRSARVRVSVAPSRSRNFASWAPPAEISPGRSRRRRARGSGCRPRRTLSRRLVFWRAGALRPH